MTNYSIDLSYLKNISMGNRGFELKLLKTFVEQTAIEMEIIRQSLEEEDWDSLYASAHKIKPSFHFIGGLETETVLQSIENSARDKNNWEKLPELVHKCLQSCKLVMNEVKIKIEEYQD